MNTVAPRRTLEDTERSPVTSNTNRSMGNNPARGGGGHLPLKRFTKSKFQKKSGETHLNKPIIIVQVLRTYYHDGGFLWGRNKAGWSNYRSFVVLLTFLISLLMLTLWVQEYTPSRKKDEGDIATSLFVIIGLFIFQNVLLFVDHYYLVKFHRSKKRHSIILISNIVFWILFIIYWTTGKEDFYRVSLVTGLITLIDLGCNSKKNIPCGTNYNGLANFGIMVFRSLIGFKVIDGAGDLWWLIFLPFVFIGGILSLSFIYHLPCFLYKAVECNLKKGEALEFVTVHLPAPIPLLIVPLFFITSDYGAKYDSSNSSNSSTSSDYMGDRPLSPTVFGFGALIMVAFIFFFVCPIIRFKTVKKTELANKPRKQRITQNQNVAKRTYLSFFQISSTLFSDTPPDTHYPCPSANSDSSLCYVCYEKKYNTIFDPCGHGGICGLCAKSVLKMKKECPQCRKPTNVVLVYEETPDGQYIQVDEYK